MRTGDHILQLTTVSTVAKPHKYRATCTCGEFKHQPVTAAHARILHGSHVDAAMTGASDANRS